MSAQNRSFTVAWERPEANFDYYRVEVTGSNSATNATVEPDLLGSCANGSIVDASQTRLTCDHVEDGTKVTFRIRTHARGPPERASPGVALEGIVIPWQALPDVANLTMVSAQNRSFTVAWERPEANFDYYRVEVTGSSSASNATVGPDLLGSCVYGSMVDANQTRLTCDHVKECTEVTFRIRTHARGPPERASSGVALEDIVIPWQDSPNNLTILPITPSLSRLQWEPPINVSDILRGYTVRICDRYGTCDAEPDLDGCVEYSTLNNWLDFETTEQALYCVVVKASAWCSGHVLPGSPAQAEVMAPLFGLPDVVNLRLISARNRSFTVSWERPEVDFDYYRVEVTDSSGASNATVAPDLLGSCANGSIVGANQTRVTCDHVEDCTDVTFKIRGYTRGPPERTSSDVVLEGIVIPGPVPDSPNNLTVLPISSSLSRLQWEPPTNVPGGLGEYTVRICNWYWPCDAEPDMSGCDEHRTSDNWLDFETTEGRPYCVLVRASAWCYDHVVMGSPAPAEVMAPFIGGARQ
nr:uncharacterized protein LOC129388286 [Dermacentor andersoni]